jgi:hypothetical protein
MSSLRLRRVSRPETLRAIDPDRLRQFLLPFAKQLSAHGFNLPKVACQPVNCQALAEFLATAGPELPADLLDALHMVDELATPEGADRLLVAAQMQGKPLNPAARMTPADAAIELWLIDRELLRRQHTEALLRRPTSFRSYQSMVFPPPRVKMPGKGKLAALAADLDEVFEVRHRGRGTEVRSAAEGDVLAFLVRHGDLCRREGRMDGQTVHYRPEKYDVVLYHPEAGELRINARSEWERQLYRTAFAKHLFGNPVFFTGDSRYTLEPLRREGQASLVCRDVPDIDRITLRELHLVYESEQQRFEIQKAADLLADTAFEIPCIARLVGAGFAVKFSAARAVRSVIIRPPNVARYTRNADSVLVEEWLGRRGFLLPEHRHDSDSSVSTMAVA